MKRKWSYFRHPIKTVKTKLYVEYFKSVFYRHLINNDPQKAVNMQWKCYFGKTFPWSNPYTLDEKIQWLSAMTDTTQWSLCSDKYEVRHYVESKGYRDIIIPSYGCYEQIEDIDFSVLPTKFVIKCTHDQGSTYLVDKNKDDLRQVCEKIKMHQKTPFGQIQCEPHYLRIKPRILIEELLPIQSDFESCSLVDYKMWCLNGIVYSCFVCYDRHRDENGHLVATYDVYHVDSWEPWRESLSDKYRIQNFKDVPQPQNLDKMITIAEDLSKGFPEVRVDLYNINGKIYFGEMTFTSMCGRCEYFSEKTLANMGQLIDISIIKPIR